jgi:cell division protein FtsQ
MSKVDRSGKSSKASGRRKAQVIELQPDENVRVSSILFGLAILTALIVAAAAWMGGSLSQVERRVGNFMDSSARSLGLAVEYVSVEGVPEDLAEQVRFAALVEPGENMFRADPYKIRERVEDTRLVVNVQVHRFWPDHILILADAVKPVALWKSGESWKVVDALGRVMPEKDNQLKTGSLLRIAGAGGDEAAPDLVAAFAEFPKLAERVVLARRMTGERWDVQFDTGIIVRLPRDASMPPAVRRLAFMERDNDILARPLEAIDLRHAEQIFLTPERVTTAAVAEAER